MFVHVLVQQSFICVGVITSYAIMYFTTVAFLMFFEVVFMSRREYELVNGIQVGYESDDSWDQNSITHEPEHAHNHTHNIVPLLALHTWTNSPNRGRGQLHRQNNNINVRSGNAPYPRPWEGQPYGRCTRSQQALHGRAYRKWQRRYQVP